MGPEIIQIPTEIAGKISNIDYVCGNLNEIMHGLNVDLIILTVQNKDCLNLNNSVVSDPGLEKVYTGCP